MGQYAAAQSSVVSRCQGAHAGRGCLHYRISSQLLEESPFHILDTYVPSKFCSNPVIRHLFYI